MKFDIMKDFESLVIFSSGLETYIIVKIDQKITYPSITLNSVIISIYFSFKWYSTFNCKSELTFY